jgi:hypothetical protein
MDSNREDSENHPNFKSFERVLRLPDIGPPPPDSNWDWSQFGSDTEQPA